MKSQPFLDIDVTHQLGDFTLNACFAAESGLTALFGRSGAGKSSLINLIAGLHQPGSGRISINNQVVFDKGAGINLPPENRRIGYVFQDSRLFPHMNVTQNLSYGMNLTPVSERHQSFDKIVKLLDLTNLLERRTTNLSGGEKQRVAIGRALLSSPRLLIMDEPLAALDARRKGEVISYIERLRDELGLPIIYVSHAMEEVIRLADTMVIIDNGKTVAAGPVEEIMSRLDLRPLTGRYEAGAVLSVTITNQDTHYGLTELGFSGGKMLVPHIDMNIGSDLRIRIRSRDISLSLSRPTDTSVLNIFEGVVTEISPENENTDEIQNQKDVKINIGVPLIARVTRKSMDALKLEPGSKVYALVKAAAIDRHSLGLAGKVKPRE